MITLDEAVTGMLESQDKLRTPAAKEQPAYLSEQFYRLGQFTAAIEYHLALLEEQYEHDESVVLHEAIRVKKMSATAAEKEVKIELGDIEGKIKYLKRITDASWSLHMGAISRHKHLTMEVNGAI